MSSEKVCSLPTQLRRKSFQTSLAFAFMAAIGTEWKPCIGQERNLFEAPSFQVGSAIPLPAIQTNSIGTTPSLYPLPGTKLTVSHTQEANEKSKLVLPDAEQVIPLPAVPPPKDFQGFGDRKSLRVEELPSPHLPPKYEFPKREATPSLASPQSSQGVEGLIPIRPLQEYQGQEKLWMPHPPQAPTNDTAVAPAQYAPSLPLDQPWTMITADAKQQLDELAHRCPPAMNGQACQVPYSPFDFSPTPAPCQSYNPPQDMQSYYGKECVPTQRPWVEWWRPFYQGGIFAPAIPVFSDVNPLIPQFIVYGDYRTGVGIHRNAGQPVRTWAHRLNLEADLKLTATERIHASMGPLDHNNRFTRLDFSNGLEFEEELDAQLNTVFFEGDVGAMVGGYRGVYPTFDLPISFGLLPLIYQNGIWMEDAIIGGALAFPWRHSLPFNWSNFDATFFAGFHDVTSPAFGNDPEPAGVVGTAWFIEAYQGYIEADYAYLNDQEGLNRDYHNFAFAYSRRYWTRISNSVRVIVNLGQEGPRTSRTADGGLFLFENSLISAMPSTVVPYFNAFVGYGTPQSVARAAGSGGILRNTGINFESDGLTGYPTLDPTGSNSFGGALGVNLLSADFRRQFAVEFAGLDTYGNDLLSRAAGPQYGLGTRWQKAINNASLIRIDLMSGWLDNAPDIYGSRIEYRWKF